MPAGDGDLVGHCEGRPRWHRARASAARELLSWSETGSFQGKMRFFDEERMNRMPGRDHTFCMAPVLDPRYLAKQEDPTL